MLQQRQHDDAIKAIDAASRDLAAAAAAAALDRRCRCRCSDSVIFHILYRVLRGRVAVTARNFYLFLLFADSVATDKRDAATATVTAAAAAAAANARASCGTRVYTEASECAARL